MPRRLQRTTLHPAARYLVKLVKLGLKPGAILRTSSPEQRRHLRQCLGKGASIFRMRRGSLEGMTFIAHRRISLRQFIRRLVRNGNQEKGRFCGYPYILEPGEQRRGPSYYIELYINNYNIYGFVVPVPEMNERVAAWTAAHLAAVKPHFRTVEWRYRRDNGAAPMAPALAARAGHLRAMH